MKRTLGGPHRGATDRRDAFCSPVPTVFGVKESHSSATSRSSRPAPPPPTDATFTAGELDQNTIRHRPGPERREAN